MARAAGRCKVIAISDAIYPCWFADICYSSDRRWFEYHGYVDFFGGARVCHEATEPSGMWHLIKTGDEGFDEVPGNVRTGSNSGHQAIHLSAQIGAKEIIVTAMDFTNDGARSHWFGLHQGIMDKSSNVSLWRRQLRVLTDELMRRGIAVKNASPNSTLTWLPRTSTDQL